MGYMLLWLVYNWGKKLCNGPLLSTPKQQRIMSKAEKDKALGTNGSQGPTCQFWQVLQHPAQCSGPTKRIPASLLARRTHPAGLSHKAARAQIAAQQQVLAVPVLLHRLEQAPRMLCLCSAGGLVLRRQQVHDRFKGILPQHLLPVLVLNLHLAVRRAVLWDAPLVPGNMRIACCGRVTWIYQLARMALHGSQSRTRT